MNKVENEKEIKTNNSTETENEKINIVLKDTKEIYKEYQKINNMILHIKKSYSEKVLEFLNSLIITNENFNKEEIEMFNNFIILVENKKIYFNLKLNDTKNQINDLIVLLDLLNKKEEEIEKQK